MHVTIGSQRFMNKFLSSSVIAFSIVTACAPVDEADVNPKTCSAVSDGITLSCEGSGIEGELYTCDCIQLDQTQRTCAADSECDQGDLCVDRLCHNASSFTDATICIDGINAEEVIDRCAGLPQD